MLGVETDADCAERVGRIALWVGFVSVACASAATAAAMLLGDRAARLAEAGAGCASGSRRVELPAAGRWMCVDETEFRIVSPARPGLDSREYEAVRAAHFAVACAVVALCTTVCAAAYVWMLARVVAARAAAAAPVADEKRPLLAPEPASA